MTGTLEVGESPRAGALRELAEETGLVPELLVETGVTVPHAGGAGHLAIFAARVAPGAGVTLNWEHSAYRWCPADEARVHMPEFSHGHLTRAEQLVRARTRSGAGGVEHECVAPPALRGAGLRLDPLSQRDSEGMFALWCRPEVCEHSGPAVDAAGAPIPLPAASRADSDRLLQYWLAREAEGTGFRWAVRVGPELAPARADEFAGAVGFNSLGRCAELAYHLVPTYWGRGIGHRACRLAVDWAFANGAESVEAFVLRENRPSVRLLSRLGFRPAESLRDRPPRFLLERPR